ncbi:metal dependent phosphohydrolase [Nitritalea halalkaliphila LW7]|uniref:Metal dependent phosphohydrolase n=1 Tax=Nitritalea halalkaliphila LW7 TaxID=1189621 RepID=I5C1H1_9BACT|nr:HD domain-containing protein [Nitritalea halalkaliphila]EIM75673.1 metal dependent phosphohydrolase [Nitritalea halalkaliphila LW7]
MKSQKIINDPVYGFITIPSELIFTLISHPYFQRLRRIKQLGLTDFVYPGALHTRFHHALGAMHLMRVTLDHLRAKGTEITPEEYEAAIIAILLHDVGHGPFSHALEFSILQGITHEELSLMIMEELNTQHSGQLSLAIRMFTDTYERRFFHQLVSSQLDIDRLDYLQRDCFFTGVSEGTIGADRIIKMMAIVDDQVVVEEKGIYSIENFLSARRLMYWQVYLHKTTVSAEKMLINLVRRAQHLGMEGAAVPATDALAVFLAQPARLQDFKSDPSLLKSFLSLDDYDIWAGVKTWKGSADPVLRGISQMLLERNLFKVTLSSQSFSVEELEALRVKTKKRCGLREEHVDYFFTHGAISNFAYVAKERILIQTKKGEIIDVAQAADLPNIKAMSKIVKKYYACKAKSLNL